MRPNIGRARKKHREETCGDRHRPGSFAEFSTAVLRGESSSRPTRIYSRKRGSGLGNPGSWARETPFPPCLQNLLVLIPRPSRLLSVLYGRGRRIVAFRALKWPCSTIAQGPVSAKAIGSNTGNSCEHGQAPPAALMPSFVSQGSQPPE